MDLLPNNDISQEPKAKISEYEQKMITVDDLKSVYNDIIDWVEDYADNMDRLSTIEITESESAEDLRARIYARRIARDILYSLGGELRAKLNEAKEVKRELEER
nr:MAG TPA: hypothetical protein [Caudoviricetes sp.]